jgi:cyclohexadienyl dehydratase
MNKMWPLVMLAVALSVTAASAEGIIQNIEKAKKIRVCEAQDNPWSSINPISGEWEGFTVDMVKGFAATMEADVEIIDSGWSGLVQSLSTGKCDLAAAPMFATVPRGKLVLFTVPFAAEGQVAAVKQDSDMHKFGDLDQPGKTIIGEAGSATTEFAKRFFKKATVKLYTSNDNMARLADVASGRADAAWLAYTSNAMLLKANPNLGVRFLDEKPVGFSPIRWAVPAGEYQFQQLVNIWIEDAISSGVAEQAWDKWFPGVVYQMKAK